MSRSKKSRGSTGIDKEKDNNITIPMSGDKKYSNGDFNDPRRPNNQIIQPSTADQLIIRDFVYDSDKYKSPQRVVVMRRDSSPNGFTEKEKKKRREVSKRIIESLFRLEQVEWAEEEGRTHIFCSNSSPSSPLGFNVVARIRDAYKHEKPWKVIEKLNETRSCEEAGKLVYLRFAGVRRLVDINVDLELALDICTRRSPNYISFAILTQEFRDLEEKRQRKCGWKRSK